MIWYIVLAVWLIGNVVWNYRFYKEKQFLCIGIIFQGIFAGVPSLFMIFSDWMSEKFEWWTDPILISKGLKKDIDFLHNEMDQHIKNAAKELIQEIDKEIKKDETRRNIKKKTKNKK